LFGDVPILAFEDPPAPGTPTMDTSLGQIISNQAIVYEFIMGVEKTVIKEGNGSDKPRKGDTVTMEYTGWLYEPDKPENKGNKFDSSVGKGDFNTKIGVGRVIRGWDEGILGNASSEAMTLGEKANLVISGDYAYGDRGFPGLIPPNATLML